MNSDSWKAAIIKKLSTQVPVAPSWEGTLPLCSETCPCCEQFFGLEALLAGSQYRCAYTKKIKGRSLSQLKGRSLSQEMCEPVHRAVLGEPINFWESSAHNHIDYITERLEYFRAVLVRLEEKL